MVNAIEQFILYDSPAGSGKTTTIKNIISEIHIKNPKNRILCITYTNRAAEELNFYIDSSFLYCGTIHSFIYDFISPFFKHKEAIDLYFELFESNINERIKDEKGKYEESNNKYKEKYGDLTLENIKNNLKQIEYGESTFTAYYYGRLSHDDLLLFASEFSKKYNILYNKISSKYDYIFIDEVQDTSTNILELFYNAVKNTNTRLYLFGDKMQQIYKYYDGGFDEHLKEFKNEHFEYNYRSSEEIVSVLNNLYNDSNRYQISYNGKNNIKPKVIITNDIYSEIINLRTTKTDLLELYLVNSEKYKQIGAFNLFDQITKMDKYNYAKSTYSPNDILMDNSIDNPDNLFRLLFIINKLYVEIINENYGHALKIEKNKKYFIKKLDMYNHSDKEKVKKELKNFVNIYQKEQTIRELIDKYINQKWIVKIDELDNEDYNDVLNVEMNQFNSICEFLNNPLISTQHGVKGESHNIVLFKCDDSNNLNIKMYDFLNLLANEDINLNDFSKFTIEYDIFKNKILNLFNNLKDNINSGTFNLNKEQLDKIVNEFKNNYINNKYYKYCVNDILENYINKQNVTNFKKIIGEKPKSMLNAYKLFYVGCSRARKELYIIIEENRIINFEQQLKNKMKNIGFEVD